MLVSGQIASPRRLRSRDLAARSCDADQGFGLPDAADQCPKNGYRIDAYSPNNLDEFDGIKPTLPAFVFCNEGLRLTDLLGELLLCQAGLFARLDHEGAKLG